MILLQAYSSNDFGLGLVTFVIGLAILVGLFLLFRSILLWYWKVDTIVKNQEETNALLRDLTNKIVDIHNIRIELDHPNRKKTEEDQDPL